MCRIYKAIYITYLLINVVIKFLKKKYSLCIFASLSNKKYQENFQVEYYNFCTFSQNLSSVVNIKINTVRHHLLAVIVCSHVSILAGSFSVAWLDYFRAAGGVTQLRAATRAPHVQTQQTCETLGRGRGRGCWAGRLSQVTEHCSCSHLQVVCSLNLVYGEQIIPALDGTEYVPFKTNYWESWTKGFLRGFDWKRG